MRYLAQRIVNENGDLIDLLIKFFTAEVTDPTSFADIQQICIKKTKELNRPYGEQFITLGYLSAFDFHMYVTEKKMGIKGGIPSTIVDIVLNSLTEAHVLHHLPSNLASNSRDIRYKAGGEYCKFLYERHAIYNVLGGWQFIVQRYSQCVFKIVNINSEGDHSIGTGFYYAAGNSEIAKYLIITNRHVIEKASKIEIYSVDDKEVSYEKIIPDTKNDLAYIILKEKLEIETFHLYPEPEVLSDIITIGYPSIPMTAQAYQISHKGEVNSFVETYNKNRFFLFSAKTSSGNSGSPIINNYGMVVGIVAQDFFEQAAFFEKGKPSYYAGIPGVEIINSANELVFGSARI
ncbi:serine protease [Daejeonella sp. JGW-45]|uniref:S1 family peptidase n=1 Tax=Daejeonella sp. JGW-45 TaxID=3034148 RepID=UPI0023EA7A29|nr:serine protease [Daejeonella sp. JGW-45]